jgi:hypothetical protein
LGFAKNAVPKLAIIFKEVLRVVDTGQTLSQVTGMVKIGWREMTMRRVHGQGRSKTLPSVGQLQSALW